MSILVDKHGNPLQSATPDPGLRGGWIQTGGITGGFTPSLDSVGIYGVDRRMERRKSRVAYFLNPVYWGALQVVQSYVIGDAFSWGDHPDKRVRDIVNELTAINHLPDLAERFWTEFSLDGENATVWTGELRRDEPAALAFLDVDRGIELDSDTISGVTRIQADRESWDAGEFTWTAFDALYNDPRGWPLARHAVDAAVASVNLINNRLRAQDINGRINGVYKAFVNSSADDGGLAQHKAKAAIYNSIPKDGAVLTIAKDAKTGQSEELEFLDLARGAADAASDARIVRLVLALVVGVPEHYLGEGGQVTRTTADAMGDPARRSLLRKQAIVRSWLDRVVRTELTRRFGPQQRYRTQIIELDATGRRRRVRSKMVPAAQVEVPWVFPDLTSDDMIALTRLVDMAVKQRLMSMQTARARLGLDPAVERERLELERAEGETPPPPTPPGRNPPGPARDDEDDDGAVDTTMEEDE